MRNSTQNTNNNFNFKDINCWIITEGLSGTENQCIAVAERLGVAYSVKRIALQHPFRIISPYLIKKAPKSAVEGIDWYDPQPDLIIASGRKAVPVALQFQKAFTVFLQDPKISPDNFDLVAAPAHDQLEGKNVIPTTAAPNRVTPALLKEALTEFDFSALPSKKIAVLIGGNSKTHTMPDDFAVRLYTQLDRYLQSDEYGFLATVSRRTPTPIITELKTVFERGNSFFWDGTGSNPYHAYLADADFILVTEDSTSMLSDACSTGKPVYRLSLEGGSAKFDRLYKALEKRCGLRLFEGELETWTYEPLDDAQLVADNIRKAFAK